jgi:anti-anti-sigma factor
MKYTLEKTEQYTLFQIHTEKIDALKTPELKSELTRLNAEGVKSFILDFSEVKYVDSSGLSAILLANRICEGSNGILVLFGLQDAIRKLIHISQLDKVLHILPSKAEAVDAVFLHTIESDLKSNS